MSPGSTHEKLNVLVQSIACVSICDGEVVKKDTMPAEPRTLIAYIRNTFQRAEVETAYEAGFFSELLISRGF